MTPNFQRGVEAARAIVERLRQDREPDGKIVMGSTGSYLAGAVDGAAEVLVALESIAATPPPAPDLAAAGEVEHAAAEEILRLEHGCAWDRAEPWRRDRATLTARAVLRVAAIRAEATPPVGNTLVWRICANAGRGRPRAPRWTHVKAATGVGSTTARIWCSQSDLDPYEEVGEDEQQAPPVDLAALRRILIAFPSESTEDAARRVRDAALANGTRADELASDLAALREAVREYLAPVLPPHRGRVERLRNAVVSAAISLVDPTPADAPRAGGDAAKVAEAYQREWSAAHEPGGDLGPPADDEDADAAGAGDGGADVDQNLAGARAVLQRFDVGSRAGNGGQDDDPRLNGYICTGCGAKGCKLWRQYQTFADHIRLLCVRCAGKDQKRDTSTVDADGKIVDETVGRPCDQIGWLVPAVPSGDGSFWGYTSVPDADVSWWRALPSKPATKAQDADAAGEVGRVQAPGWIRGRINPMGAGNEADNQLEPPPDSNPAWLDKNDPYGSFARSMDQVVEAVDEADDAIKKSRGQS